MALPLLRWQGLQVIDHQPRQQYFRDFQLTGATVAWKLLTSVVVVVIESILELRIQGSLIFEYSF